MDKTRLWIIGSVLAMVAIGALGWVLGVQPQLDAASAANDQTVQVAGMNTASAAVLAKLERDSKNLPALKDRLSELSTSVPADADTPAFATELNGFAAANGVTITGWQISDAQAFTPPATVAATPAPTAGPGASSSPTPTPTPTASPTPAAAQTSTAGMPPAASPLVEGTDFAVVPVSVTVNGDYPHILAFTEAAQKGGRLFLVNGLEVMQNADGHGMDGKVSGYIYVLATAKAATSGK